MFTPSRSSPALFIYDPMTRQFLRPRRISERPTHHPGMAGPPRQSRDITVRGHLAARNLTDNTQHVSLKRPHLIHRHFIWIILHLFQNDTKGDGSVMYRFAEKQYKTEPSPFVLKFALLTKVGIFEAKEVEDAI